MEIPPIPSDKKAALLQALRDTGRVGESCILAAVKPQVLRHFRLSDPEFEDEVQEALKLYGERLEKEAHRRAVEGVVEPVFGSLGQGQGSGEIGRVTKYSDRLLEIMLKKNNPAYRDSFKIDATVSGGVLVVEKTAGDAKEWKERHEGAAD